MFINKQKVLLINVGYVSPITPNIYAHCYPHLLPPLVTPTCHPYLLPPPVTPTFHPISIDHTCAADAPGVPVEEEFRDVFCS